MVVCLAEKGTGQVMHMRAEIMAQSIEANKEKHAKSYHDSRMSETKGH